MLFALGLALKKVFDFQDMTDSRLHLLNELDACRHQYESVQEENSHLLAQVDQLHSALSRRQSPGDLQHDYQGSPKFIPEQDAEEWRLRLVTLLDRGASLEGSLFSSGLLSPSSRSGSESVLVSDDGLPLGENEDSAPKNVNPSDLKSPRFEERHDWELVTPSVRRVRDSTEGSRANALWPSAAEQHPIPAAQLPDRAAVGNDVYLDSLSPLDGMKTEEDVNRSPIYDGDRLRTTGFIRESSSETDDMTARRLGREECQKMKDMSDQLEPVDFGSRYKRIARDHSSLQFEYEQFKAKARKEYAKLKNRLIVTVKEFNDFKVKHSNVGVLEAEISTLKNEVTVLDLVIQELRSAQRMEKEQAETETQISVPSFIIAEHSRSGKQRGQELTDGMPPDVRKMTEKITTMELELDVLRSQCSMLAQKNVSLEQLVIRYRSTCRQTSPLVRSEFVKPSVDRVGDETSLTESSALKDEQSSTQTLTRTSELQTTVLDDRDRVLSSENRQLTSKIQEQKLFYESKLQSLERKCTQLEKQVTRFEETSGNEACRLCSVLQAESESLKLQNEMERSVAKTKLEELLGRFLQLEAELALERQRSENETVSTEWLSVQLEQFGSCVTKPVDAQCSLFDFATNRLPVAGPTDACNLSERLTCSPLLHAASRSPPAERLGCFSGSSDNLFGMQEDDDTPVLSFGEDLNVSDAGPDCSALIADVNRGENNEVPFSISRNRTLDSMVVDDSLSHTQMGIILAISKNSAPCESIADDGLLTGSAVMSDEAALSSVFLQTRAFETLSSHEPTYPQRSRTPQETESPVNAICIDSEKESGPVDDAKPRDEAEWIDENLYLKSIGDAEPIDHRVQVQSGTESKPMDAATSIDETVTTAVDMIDATTCSDLKARIEPTDQPLHHARDIHLTNTVEVEKDTFSVNYPTCQRQSRNLTDSSEDFECTFFSCDDDISTYLECDNGIATTMFFDPGQVMEVIGVQPDASTMPIDAPHSLDTVDQLISGVSDGQSDKCLQSQEVVKHPVEREDEAVSTGIVGASASKSVKKKPSTSKTGTPAMKPILSRPQTLRSRTPSGTKKSAKLTQNPEVPKSKQGSSSNSSSSNREKLPLVPIGSDATAKLASEGKQRKSISEISQLQKGSVNLDRGLRDVPGPSSLPGSRGERKTGQAALEASATIIQHVSELMQQTDRVLQQNKAWTRKLKEEYSEANRELKKMKQMHLSGTREKDEANPTLPVTPGTPGLKRNLVKENKDERKRLEEKSNHEKELQSLKTLYEAKCKENTNLLQLIRESGKMGLASELNQLRVQYEILLEDKKELCRTFEKERADLIEDLNNLRSTVDGPSDVKLDKTPGLVAVEVPNEALDQEIELSNLAFKLQESSRQLADLSARYRSVLDDNAGLRVQLQELLGAENMCMSDLNESEQKKLVWKGQKHAVDNMQLKPVGEMTDEEEHLVVGKDSLQNVLVHELQKHRPRHVIEGSDEQVDEMKPEELPGQETSRPVEETSPEGLANRKPHTAQADFLQQGLDEETSVDQNQDKFPVCWPSEETAADAT